MKRIATLVLAIVLMLTITMSATAAEFVPSITNKGAPDFVVIDKIDGKDLVGFITDGDGNKLSDEFLDCFDITSLYDALNNNPDIPDEIKEALKEAYEALNKSDSKISKVCPAIDEFVKEFWGKDKSADDLVVKDLFDITEKCDDAKTHLVNGSTIDLTFDLGIGKNVFVAGMVFVDGKWQPVVNIKNNGDGTITVTFDKLCPVAFLVPSTQLNSSTVSPTTGDYTSAAIWGGVLLISIASVAVVLIYRRKKYN